MTTDTQNYSTETTNRQFPSHTFYKPNRNGTGGAVTFNMSRDKQAVFVEAANQIAEKRFDWDHKIVMKWGMSDLGIILAGLQGNLPESKLFHQTERANSACTLRPVDPDSQNNEMLSAFWFTISKQNGQDKSVTKVSITLSPGEAAILETALKRAIEQILQW